jgi:hypothetical protein
MFSCVLPCGPRVGRGPTDFSSSHQWDTMSRAARRIGLAGRTVTQFISEADPIQTDNIGAFVGSPGDALTHTCN